MISDIPFLDKIIPLIVSAASPDRELKDKIGFVYKTIHKEGKVIYGTTTS
jgi:hypothetical protein